jgi:hypothetical protein
MQTLQDSVGTRKAAMLNNRISSYYEESSPAGDPQPTTERSKPAGQSTLGGFVVVPLPGVPGSLGPTAAPFSIYDLARREAIERSQERLIALLRSRWQMLKT